MKSKNYPAANNIKKQPSSKKNLKNHINKKKLNTKLPATTLKRVFYQAFLSLNTTKKREKERDISHYLKDRERSELWFLWFNLGERS